MQFLWFQACLQSIFMYNFILDNNSSFHGTDSDLSTKPRSLYKERGYGSRKDRDRWVGSVQGQRGPKHGRQDGRRNKVHDIVVINYECE